MPLEASHSEPEQSVMGGHPSNEKLEWVCQRKVTFSQLFNPKVFVLFGKVLMYVLGRSF